jgi:hypothetical protein
MKPRYKSAILRDHKTTTIRWGHKDYKKGAARIKFGQAGELPVEITKVVKVYVKDLTEEIANEDGFENISMLRRALMEHYPNISESDPITIVHFRRSNNS